MSEANSTVETPLVNYGFRKGVSGNPKGMTPGVGKRVTITELCRKLSPQAVRRLEYWMNQNKSPSQSIEAIKVILDRGFGRPVVPIADGTGHEALELDLSGLTDAQLRRIESTMLDIARRSFAISDAPVIIEAESVNNVELTSAVNIEPVNTDS